jgi:3-hydroxybutyryl-CoA dehydratase
MPGTPRIPIGANADWYKLVTEQDLLIYIAVCLDTNPIPMDDAAGCQSGFGGRIAHGMLSVDLISASLGTRLPGPGTIYLRQSLKFGAPVKIGHTMRASMEITDLNLSRKSATLRTRCMVKEDVVIDGEAIVLVPTRV